MNDWQKLSLGEEEKARSIFRLRESWNEEKEEWTRPLTLRNFPYWSVVVIPSIIVTLLLYLGVIR